MYGLYILILPNYWKAVIQYQTQLHWKHNAIGDAI